MIQIDKTIVSFEVLKKKFECNLSKCKGACCILGDSGAPLEESETEILDKIFTKIKPYLRKEGIESIEKQGTWVIDSDGDMVTPLIEGKECAYVVFDGDIALCGIEKAWFDKKIKFRKPISCHLYPVRVKKYAEFDAVNYNEWDICKDAVIQGEKNNSELYLYLKEPLVRKFGKKWYEELTIAKKLLEK